MVAVSDFSGLAISACALASAAASVPTLVLDRCMSRLLSLNVKADGAGLRAFGPDAMTGSFPGILRHQRFQLGLGLFMIEGRLSGRLKQAGELGPGIGPAHVDGSDRFNFGPRRLDPKEVRGLASLNAAPELLLRGEQEMLVERIGWNGHLYPFAAARDDRQHRSPRGCDPHVVLQLGHMFFG